MLHLYGHLSEWAFALLIIGLFVLVSIATLTFYYRFLPRYHFEPGSVDFGVLYAGAIGSIFALIFAFVIIAVWQNFDRVAANLGQETNVLHNIDRTLGGYPAEFREGLRGRLRAYVDRVIRVEWPLLGYGSQDPEAERQISEFNALLIRYPVSSPSEQVLQGRMLDLLERNRALRLDRIKGGQSYLDATMWVALGLGSLTLLHFSCMLNMASRRQHYHMHGVLAASLGLVYFLLLSYNYPFLGPGALDDGPFRKLQEQVLERD